MKKKCGLFILGMLIAGLFVMVKIYKSSTKIITLSWAVFDSPYDYSVAEQALNKNLEKKNYPYEIKFMNFSMDYEKTYAENFDAYMEFIKQENIDLVNCPGIWGAYDVYAMMIQNKMLEPLDYCINKTDIGKALYESYPEKLWETMKDGGKIYGVLTPYTNLNYYAVIKAEYGQKYGIGKEELSIQTLKKILLKAQKEAEAAGNEAFIAGVSLPYYHFAANYEYTVCNFVEVSTDENIKAVNILQEPMYENWLKDINQIYLAGALADEKDYWEKLEKGEFLMVGGYSYSSETAAETIRAAYGIPEECELYAVEMPELKNPLNGSGMKNAVSANSGNKEKAVEVLAAIYSDSELSNAIVYGEEGVSYTKKDGFAIYTDDYAETGMFLQEAFGNPFLVYPGQNDIADKQQRLWEAMENAELSKLAGFHFNMEQIGETIQKLNTISMKNQLLYGKTKDLQTDLEKAREEADKAGIESIVEEMNRQLSDW